MCCFDLTARLDYGILDTALQSMTCGLEGWRILEAICAGYSVL